MGAVSVVAIRAACLRDPRIFGMRDPRVPHGRCIRRRDPRGLLFFIPVAWLQGFL